MGEGEGGGEFKNKENILLEKKQLPIGEKTIVNQQNILATPLPLRIINPAVSEPTSQAKAVFLPKIGTFLENCGIKTEYVNPIAIGKGANHTVFLYSPPNEEKMVIKIPNETASLSQDQTEEQRSIEVTKNAFGKYTLPTEVKVDKISGKYCIVQKAVKGKAITNKNYKEGNIQSQLAEIVVMNHKLLINPVTHN